MSQKALLALISLYSVLGECNFTREDWLLPLNDAPFVEPLASNSSIYAFTSRIYAESSILNFLGQYNHRYAGFDAALQLIIERNSMILIGTGVRSISQPNNCIDKGCFAFIFSDFANLSNRNLSIIEANEMSCESAKSSACFYVDSITLINQDSISYLSDFQGDLIDFLYLDSSDYDSRNAFPAQNHHLKEIQAAYDKLHKNSIVMMDECFGGESGKCKLVREFLINLGWTVYHSDFIEIYVYN